MPACAAGSYFKESVALQTCPAGFLLGNRNGSRAAERLISYA